LIEGEPDLELSLVLAFDWLLVVPGGGGGGELVPLLWLFLEAFLEE